jgi:hypothetical protein
MVKKHMKAADGQYHINGKKFELLEGSRAQVMHKTAYKTAGGLTVSNLMKNKHGHYVSVKKHNTAKREKRLLKAGYGTVKGKFGAVKLNGTRKQKKSRRHRKRK